MGRLELAFHYHDRYGVPGSLSLHEILFPDRRGRRGILRGASGERQPSTSAKRRA